MSADFFHGIPFNIASYALLVHIICEMINNDEEYTGDKFEVGNLTIAIGDYHVYESHLKVVNEQIERIPFLFPTLSFNKKISKIDDLNFEDITLENYYCHSALKTEMVA